MAKQLEAFETLPQAAERIKRERLAALEKQFPSRWFRSGWRRNVLLALEMLLALTVIASFLKLMTVIGWINDRMWAVSVVIVLFFVSSQLFDSARGSWLERIWRARHPEHPFATAEAREAAIASASDPRLLRLAAISAFLAWLETQPNAQEPHYRHPAEKLGWKEALDELLTLKEFLADPSTYRVINHLGALSPVRINTSAPSTDEERADGWFEDILARHEAVLRP